MTGGAAKRARLGGGGDAGAGGSQGVDRLSALPDCLLHAIMSFMKARQVVQTSVLSKRWARLWRSVPCLDLDARDAEFRAVEDEYDSSDSDADHGRRFANFVDNLLLFHEAPTLDAFRLRFGGGGAGSDQRRDADRWIRRAIKYAPTVLELHLRVRSIVLPGLGTSSRRLRRLHLSSVSLDASFARQIQFECPVLEDLKLNNCGCTFREINSHSLMILTTKDCHFYIPGEDCRDRDIIIMAPALVSLDLGVPCDTYGVSVKEATNLVQASIQFSYHSPYRYQCKLFEDLSSVRNLELTYLQTMVPIDEASVKFPFFRNLKTLLLYMCDLSNNFKTLGQFLQNAPNLEKLTLNCCELSDGSNRRMPRKKVKSMRKTLKCQNLLSFECPKLKLIEIKSGSTDNVLALFELLFGLWENLRKITVVVTKK